MYFKRYVVILQETIKKNAKMKSQTFVSIGGDYWLQKDIDQFTLLNDELKQ